MTDTFMCPRGIGMNIVYLLSFVFDISIVIILYLSSTLHIFCVDFLKICKHCHLIFAVTEQLKNIPIETSVCKRNFENSNIFWNFVKVQHMWWHPFEEGHAFRKKHKWQSHTVFSNTEWSRLIHNFCCSFLNNGL